MPRKLVKRNGHAFHPIMRKGGVHEKTHKAKRNAAKRETQKKVKDYLKSDALSRSFSLLLNRLLR